ncbi:hypothetical protein PENTCL1PPCAC_8377 [Pristionchus entomophagus]|uniref:Uncharacterized protein n=1 Tax=Pristionchus entomophagus TaxID=358040 RepID=A0AAV5SS52_9BILA|nr:hypothetical protein PENTCL1PPCAC_8377 [Pristionchus entomophagus]
MTAQLPEGYFEKMHYGVNVEPQVLCDTGKNEELHEVDCTVEALNEHTTERIKKKVSTAKPNKEKKEDTTSKVGELLQKISELTVEMDRLKQLNEEMEISTVEVFEENKDLKRQIEHPTNAFKITEEKVSAAELANNELLNEKDQRIEQLEEQLNARCT